MFTKKKKKRDLSVFKIAGSRSGPRKQSSEALSAGFPKELGVGVVDTQGSGLHSRHAFRLLSHLWLATLPFDPALTGHGDKVTVVVSRTTSGESRLAS